MPRELQRAFEGPVRTKLSSHISGISEPGVTNSPVTFSRLGWRVSERDVSRSPMEQSGAAKEPKIYKLEKRFFDEHFVKILLYSYNIYTG